MMDQSIVAQINGLFGQDVQERQELNGFVAAIRENYRQAVTQTKNGMVLFLMAWAVFCAIGVGVVDEGTLGPTRIRHVRPMMIVAPVILGWLFYYISLSTTAAGYLRTVMTQSLKHLLPKAHELGLHRLLLAPTMFGTEYYINEQSSRQWLNGGTRIWLMLLKLAFILGGALLFLHATYMMWGVAPVHVLWLVLSTLLGAICWARGFIVLITLVDLVGSNGIREGTKRLYT